MFAWYSCVGRGPFRENERQSYIGLGLETEVIKGERSFSKLLKMIIHETAVCDFNRKSLISNFKSTNFFFRKHN